MKLLQLNYSSSEAHFKGGFSCKLIWKPLVPIKNSFFVWEGTHRKILTCDNLQNSGKILVNICFMSKGDSESTNHLQPHCQFGCLGILWVALDSIKNHLVAWEGFFGRKVKWKKTTDLVLPQVIF